uniref:synaptonemal complex protein 2-like isoform X2 n=1 Tax=Monopterus albus TaxID=43700 RepID=UPI0009B35B4D|nr:synaptonemal complex protein 2-like isoform X2 [Monopterus albus]
MFEVETEDCLRRGDLSHLVSVLRSEGLTKGTLARLHQLVTKELHRSGSSRVLVVLTSLRSLSQNREELQSFIDHGLIAKVLLWFNAVYDQLTSELVKSSTPLVSLTEEFFSYFLTSCNCPSVHQLLGQASLPVSQLSVLLLHLAQVAVQTGIHFPLRLEAIRTFNSILGSLSHKQRRLIQNNKNQSETLSPMAAAVLTAGDYELQVSLTEALCLLTPGKKREERANQWFSSPDISNAFCDIKDRTFEGDCRYFLNIVNSCHGDQRRVYTLPCLTAFLDSTQLFRPEDDTLDEFWIDFNLGSGCVSFFIDEPEGFLWDSIHLLREEVDYYSLQMKDDGSTGSQTVLSVQLNNPIRCNNTRGQTVELSFSYEHQRELEEAAARVFMKVKSSPHAEDTGGAVWATPSADKHTGRSYSKNKPESQRHNNTLASFRCPVQHLSLSGSEVNNSRIEAASSLLDHQSSGTPLMMTELNDSHVEQGSRTDQIRELGCSLKVVRSDRKRVAPDAESALRPEDEPGAEPESDLTLGITAAFERFREQLHFTGCWQKVKNDVLLCLRDYQQHVSSLLTHVHWDRLLLLQRFENSITDQMNQLEESSTNLNSINTQISFFQSEIQQLGSFCEKHLQRLKSLENAELGNQSSH